MFNIKKYFVLFVVIITLFSCTASSTDNVSTSPVVQSTPTIPEVKVASNIEFVETIMPVNHHVDALIQTTSRCNGGNWNPRLTALRIYKSSEKKYFAYTFTESGAIFGASGGQYKETSQGREYITTLTPTQDTLDYKIQHFHPRVQLTIGAKVKLRPNSCEILSCTNTMTGSAGNNCESKCRPEQCHIRKGEVKFR